MKRPAFQFYPGDWRNNAKLNSCSSSAKGAWIDLLCVLHDMDEYGVCRWPLKRLAAAARVSMKDIMELAENGVIKGSDSNADDFTFTPYHAGRHGQTVILLQANGAPLWYCSRFVEDEYKRSKRGEGSRFSEDNPPPKKAIKASPTQTPLASPTHANGEWQGYGSTSSSSSSSKNKTPITTLSNFDKETVDNSKNICVQLKVFNIDKLDPTNARLLRLVSEGATIQNFLDAVADSPSGKPFNYLLSKLERVWWRRSDQSILDTAKRLGIATHGLKRSELIQRCEATLMRVHTLQDDDERKQ